jgi:hypothetical protein
MTKFTALIVFILLFSVANLHARTMGEVEGDYISIGRMGGFYRATQLQGHLTANGLGLIEVPAWFCNHPNFPYAKRKSKKEVLFVDHISITRPLGGYNQEWNHSGTQLPANDLAYIGDDKKVKYRWNLVYSRLNQYVENGYANFTINIENVPWALAREESSGPYGQNSPPRDWDEWYTFVRLFCQQLKKQCPEKVVKKLRFKIGNEYNGRKSFNGTQEDFFKYYDYSSAAIRSVFPDAPIFPGEIGGSAVHGNVNYLELVDHLAEKNKFKDYNKPLAGFARSTHSFPATQIKGLGHEFSALERVISAGGDFKKLIDRNPAFARDKVSLEFHQFGIIGNIYGDSASTEPGVRQASWQFQVLFMMKAENLLDRAWHWGTFDKRVHNRTKGEVFLPYGLSWLYLILDQMRGDETYVLNCGTPQKFGTTHYAIAAVNRKRTMVLISSFNNDRDNAVAKETTVFLPNEILHLTERSKFSYIRLTDETSIHREIKNDLARDNNLKPLYKKHGQALNDVFGMSQNTNKAVQTVEANYEKYKKIWKDSLTPKPFNSRQLKIGSQGTALNLKMEPAELFVLIIE